jgi:hypothetical protein
MARGIGDITSAEAIGFASVGLAVFVGVCLVMRAFRKKPLSAEELEAQRRNWLAVYGKLGGGEVLEVQDDQISYVYDVRGISYTAFQDVSQIADKLPEDPWTLIGAVGVKYDPRNPANSIVLSETWTGLPRKALGAP